MGLVNSAIGRHWTSEPMLQFLAIGAFVFMLYGLNNPGVFSNEQKNIVIGDALVERLEADWSKKWGRPPNTAELDHLINQFVQDEIRYREALEMGLDKNDTMVRRRLIQKITFLTEDIGRDQATSERDLEKYFQAHIDAFRLPARYSFRHVFFNTDRRENAPGDIETALATLRSASHIAGEAVGDSFLGKTFLSDEPEDRLQRAFGSDFADALKTFPLEQWSGPVRSDFGLHLIYLDKRQESRLPKFTDVRDAVRVAYSNQQRENANRRAYEDMRKRYTVVEQRASAGEK